MINKKNLRIALVLLDIIFMLLSIIFLIISFHRSRLPYDASGIYFDEEAVVTYTRDGLLVYFAIAICFIVLTAGLFYVIKKQWR